MQKKTFILVVVYLLLISIMIGGCTNMEPKTVTTTNKYPEKPINVIVPFSIGSALDMIARSLEKTAPKQVPFNGAGEVITAVLGEHVHIAFVNPILVKEQVKSGTLRILAVTGEHRMTDPILAQVPTFKEQGFDITLTNWTVVAIPKETPVEVKNKLAEGFKAMITDPEFIKNMNNAGLVVEYLGSKDSQDKWLKDNQKLATTLQETGLLELIKEQKR